MNRSFLSVRAFWRTRSSTLGAPCPAPCPGAFCWPRFPWPASFPPPPPHPRKRGCSAASQVLRGRLTSRGRASGDYRLSVPPATRRPADMPPREPQGTGHRRQARATTGSPRSRGWSFHACLGSLTARGPTTARANAPADVAFRLHNSVSTPRPWISRLNSPAYVYPCQRFADALTNANA